MFGAPGQPTIWSGHPGVDSRSRRALSARRSGIRENLLRPAEWGRPPTGTVGRQS